MGVLVTGNFSPHNATTNVPMTATVEARGERLTRTLEAQPAAVSEARRWMVSVTRGLLGSEQLESLRLIVSELVTNALRHGADGERIDLAVTPKPEFLCVQVTDDGRGIKGTISGRDAALRLDIRARIAGFDPAVH